MYEWAKELNCAITVCDIEGNIIFMNDKSKDIFSKYGNLIGKNLKDCHSDNSWKKIQSMLKSGKSNSYTIFKNGVKKMIYQTPWFEDGIVGGLVEISMVIPEEIPHYIR
ncbi:MAG: PAS sensor protein [Bacteroidales bacterium]